MRIASYARRLLPHKALFDRSRRPLLLVGMAPRVSAQGLLANSVGGTSGPTRTRQELFASTSPTAASHFSISEGENAEATSREAEKLLTRAQSPWRLCCQGRGLERDFRFGTFKATWVSLDVHRFFRCHCCDSSLAHTIRCDALCMTSETLWLQGNRL